MVNWRVVRTFCAAVFFYRKHHVKRFSCLISCGFKSLLIVRILETGVIFANFDELSDISVKFSFVSPVSFSFLALNFKRCTILHQLLKFVKKIVGCWSLLLWGIRTSIQERLRNRVSHEKAAYSLLYSPVSHFSSWSWWVFNLIFIKMVPCHCLPIAKSVKWPETRPIEKSDYPALILTAFSKRCLSPTDYKSFYFSKAAHSRKTKPNVYSHVLFMCKFSPAL